MLLRAVRSGASREGPVVPSLDLKGYSAPGVDRPLGAYALLAVVYNGLFGAFTLLVRRRGLSHEISRQATLSNLLLLGVATHKLSRLIAKDRVTSPLRDPFALYEGSASGPEINERPRGSGLRLALGELIT